MAVRRRQQEGRGAGGVGAPPQIVRVLPCGALVRGRRRGVWLELDEVGCAKLVTAAGEAARPPLRAAIPPDAHRPPSRPSRIPVRFFVRVAGDARIRSTFDADVSKLSHILFATFLREMKSKSALISIFVRVCVEKTIILRSDVKCCRF